MGLLVRLCLSDGSRSNKIRSKGNHNTNDVGIFTYLKCNEILRSVILQSELFKAQLFPERLPPWHVGGSGGAVGQAVFIGWFTIHRDDFLPCGG